LIVLGLTSGLTSIGYSIVEVTAPTELRQLECNVLAGTRMKNVHTLKRCYSHHLVLQVLLERHPPMLIALGPALSAKEPAEYVGAMRTMIRTCAELIRIPLLEFENESEITATLKYGDAARRPRRLNGLVAYHLGGPLPSRDRRAVLATATALAAVMRHQRPQQEMSA
jgi:Holliday junction resolvasome RuvABC endonuclease subunit